MVFVGGGLGGTEGWVEHLKGPAVARRLVALSPFAFPSLAPQTSARRGLEVGNSAPFAAVRRVGYSGTLRLQPADPPPFTAFQEEALPDFPPCLRWDFWHYLR